VFCQRGLPRALAIYAIFEFVRSSSYIVRLSVTNCRSKVNLGD